MNAMGSCCTIRSAICRNMCADALWVMAGLLFLPATFGQGKGIPQKNFATSEEATRALGAAYQKGDRKTAPEILGDKAWRIVFSGYPVADSRDWDAFRAEYRRTHSALHSDFDTYLQDHGCPPLPELRFFHQSPYLNLYLCPAEVDYPRSAPLAGTWHRLDSCVRATDAPFQLPDRLADRPGKLIYLSLGSLGSADAELMQRLIDILGTTRHRVIVSMGPQHDLLRLHDNIYGEEFLPQASILPLVDLVITHGGNNTYSEAFTFGKPMIALPLFWDQHDNAQRLQETGFGVRLSTYTFADDELTSAMDRLLADRALHARMAAIARRLQAHPGTVRAASLIERVARERRPITREAAATSDFLPPPAERGAPRVADEH